MRYLMSIMGSAGLAIIYGFKVNLSIAIVAMVNNTAVRELAKARELTANLTALNATMKVRYTITSLFIKCRYITL